jgi:DNA polymerase III epsilon subunit-like protein
VPSLSALQNRKRRPLCERLPALRRPRFESPQLHQEVRANRPGFPAPTIPYGRFDTLWSGLGHPGASKSLTSMCDRLVLDSSERDDRRGALLDADMTADALVLLERLLKDGESGAPRSWTSN